MNRDRLNLMGWLRSHETALPLLGALALILLFALNLPPTGCGRTKGIGQYTSAEDGGTRPDLPLPSCGDGKCAPTEDCKSCPSDCGNCAPGCGNGKCDPNEDCKSCPPDCGRCPGTCGDGK